MTEQEQQPVTEETEAVQSETPVEEEKLVPESEYLKVKAESENYFKRLQLVTAEYENYRKRTALTKSTSFFEGKADILVKILPVLDNLERAITMTKDPKTKEGIEMVMRSFEKVLEAEGIEEIAPAGEAFDPTYAEAIMAVAAAEGEEGGIVKQVCRKGYKKGDKVLRFAQVIVTQS